MCCLLLLGLPVLLRKESVQNRFLIIFGGGSVANCYNDVIMLDTKTLEWSTPQITGTPPTPRAGTGHQTSCRTLSFQSCCLVVPSTPISD